jgi:hypothetical protein
MVPKIPKKIWTFWATGTPSDMVLRCMATMKIYNPDHEFNIVTHANMAQFIEKESWPKKFNEISVQGQSDWVRLALLAKYGGFWVDASIIVTESFDWIHKLQQEQRTEGFAYYLTYQSRFNGYNTHIESWFLASIKGSEFMAKWRDEYGVIAVDRYKNKGLSYLKGIEKMYGKTSRKACRMMLNNALTNYLTVYLAAQKVWHIDGINPHFTLMEANSGPFYYVIRALLHNGLLARVLMQKNPKDDLPKLIKLISQHRRALNKWINSGKKIHPESVFATTLMKVPKEEVEAIKMQIFSANYESKIAV